MAPDDHWTWHRPGSGQFTIALDMTGWPDVVMAFAGRRGGTEYRF
jgi:hypothetical protein